MIDLLTLEAYCDQQLHAADFEDYCPNGVQVEAGQQVQRLMVGVTACQALIDAAVHWRADLLLVHHGYFWKGEAAPSVVSKDVGSPRCCAMASACSPIICRWMPMRSGATTRNWLSVANFPSRKRPRPGMAWCGVRVCSSHSLLSSLAPA